jgi:hypothetical protein
MKLWSKPMKRYLIIASLAGTAMLATPAAAMTDAECAAQWTTADVNKDGIVTETEASRFHAALRVANKPIADGKLTQATYLEHCKAGLFTRAKLDAGAPLKGANSFTETQAKDRIVAAGYANVAGLTKDADGIWRGTASDGAKAIKVAVDFKGNVVAS